MARTRSRLFVLGLIWAVAALPLQAVGAAPTRQVAAAQDVGPLPAPNTPGGGTVGTGPGTCDETALDNALGGGGMVTFNCGGPATIQIASLKTISQPTTIDGGGIITITGELNTRLFNVNNGASLSLRNIVLERGYAPGDHGGAISNGGVLSLDHTRIQDSQTDASHSGGAIYTTGPVYMLHSLLINNTGGENAGGLYASGANARVVIELSILDHNHADDATTPAAGRGGAIWVGLGADVSIIDSTVTYNHTEGDGGAVYNEGRFTSRGTAYYYNTTTQDPGASDRGYGGAIASTGPLTLTSSALAANGSRFGGGLYVGEGASASAAAITGVNFASNQAVYSGGGLFASSTNTALTVVDSVFTSNKAATGGGIWRNNTDLSIIRSTFGENRATIGSGLLSSAGSGLLSSGGQDLGSQVHVYDSTFYSNVVTTTLSASGVIDNRGLIDLRNLTLEGNSHGVFNTGGGEVMQMANTVLHNVGLNCDGDGTPPQSQGGNFSSDNSSCGLGASGDVQGAGLDPMLGPLTTTFQPFQTKFFMPLPNSPLINTATVACSPLDQRRAVRPDACDKGAVEYAGLLPQIFLPLVLRSP